MNAYVIMRNDVEIGYTTDEPICVLLENTYESRYKAMKQYFGVEQWAKDFARNGHWSSEDGCTTFSLMPVKVVTIDEILSQPEVKALIDKCNALGEEIKELKEKCKQLKED